jgi:rubrerythrin
MCFWLALDVYIIGLALAALLVMSLVPSWRENRSAVVAAAPRILLPMYPPRIQTERHKDEEEKRRAAMPIASLQAGMYVCPYCRTASEIGDMGECPGCGAPKTIPS